MWTKQVIKTSSESALSLHGFVELARPFCTKEEDSMWDQRKKEDRGPCFQWLIGNGGCPWGTDPAPGQ